MSNANTDHQSEYRKPRPLRRRNVLDQTTKFGPNMTPMVDVTLVILIFFMASATIVGHEWFLKSNLPKEEQETTGSSYSLPIPTLNADLYVQDQQVFVRGMGQEAQSLREVIEQIRSMSAQEASTIILSIRAGDDVSYESVVALSDAATSVSMQIAFR